MSNIVRAWKDEAYRQSLSTEEQAMLPANPAGEIELTDVQLEAIFGGHDHEKEATNDIDQDANQKAAATYGNKIAEFSVVWCVAKNDADLNAKTKPEERWGSYSS